METAEKIAALEAEIAGIRYQLMLKGTQLDIERQNFSQHNITKIDELRATVNELRQQLNQKVTEISKLKFRYYVEYEVRTHNIWNHQVEREIYKEALLLNEDIQIDLPSGDNWNLDDEKVLSFLSDLLSLLKHKFDEVALLRVKRI